MVTGALVDHEAAHGVGLQCRIPAQNFERAAIARIHEINVEETVVGVERGLFLKFTFKYF